MYDAVNRHDHRSRAPSALGLLGDSAVMQKVFRLIERVAPTEAGVLLTGESGSGKDLAAKSIHLLSARRGPFIAINCGALPAGAEPTPAGVFERAQGGTLLLDDVTEMPLALQTRLLRVLETRKFYPVGASAEVVADVRIIAATNRCPLQAVQSGRLREDLLYRLAVFPIELPPLRSRGDDVELLAEHFVAVLDECGSTRKKLSAQSRTTLKEHTWPGNVRELKNCIERAHILGDATLELAPLVHAGAHACGAHASGAAECGVRPPGAPASEAGAQPPRDRLDIRVGSRIHDMERSLIEATLDYFQGNKRRAADALGCSLKTLYNKLNGYSNAQECASS